MTAFFYDSPWGDLRLTTLPDDQNSVLGEDPAGNTYWVRAFDISPTVQIVRVETGGVPVDLARNIAPVRRGIIFQLSASQICSGLEDPAYGVLKPLQDRQRIVL